MAERKAEKIYDKLLSEGDITWQESDVIFQIAYDCLCRKGSRQRRRREKKFSGKMVPRRPFQDKFGRAGKVPAHGAY